MKFNIIKTNISYQKKKNTNMNIKKLLSRNNIIKNLHQFNITRKSLHSVIHTKFTIYNIIHIIVFMCAEVVVACMSSFSISRIIKHYFLNVRIMLERASSSSFRNTIGCQKIPPYNFFHALSSVSVFFRLS